MDSKRQPSRKNQIRKGPIRKGEETPKLWGIRSLQNTRQYEEGYERLEEQLL